MAKLECAGSDLLGKEVAEKLAKRIGEIDVAAMAKELEVGELLLKDILAQLARPGRDPREDLPAPVFKHGILKLEDLTAGMELTGTVLNVVDFGAFVDIGMHDSGLVHVSQLADKFVRDPHDVIAVGDIVRVWVVEVDKQRRRVSLTMIPPGTRRAGRREDRKPAARETSDRPERPAGGGRPGGPKKPRPKGPPRSKTKGPPKAHRRPKRRAKPVTPITEEMKAGKEPMRSFSDLAQFFETKDQEPAKKSQPDPPPADPTENSASTSEELDGQAPPPAQPTREEGAMGDAAAPAAEPESTQDEAPKASGVGEEPSA
jgi:uncharacterized protein